MNPQCEKTAQPELLGWTPGGGTRRPCRPERSVHPVRDQDLPHAAAEGDNRPLARGRRRTLNLQSSAL